MDPVPSPDDSFLAELGRAVPARVRDDLVARGVLSWPALRHLGLIEFSRIPGVTEDVVSHVQALLAERDLPPMD